MSVYQSWSAMRAEEPRDWYRQSDILAALRDTGVPFTWKDAKQAMAGIPRPEKRYGHYRYTQAHYDAVMQAAAQEFGCTSGTGRCDE